MPNKNNSVIQVINEKTGKFEPLRANEFGELKVSMISGEDGAGEATAANQLKILSNLGGDGGVASNTTPATAGFIGIKGMEKNAEGVVLTTWKSPAVNSSHHLLVEPMDNPIIVADGITLAPNVQIQGRTDTNNLRTLRTTTGGQLYVAPYGIDETMTNLHQVHSYGYDNVASNFKRIHMDTTNNSLNVNIKDEAVITTDGTTTSPRNQLLARTTTGNLRTLLCEDTGKLSTSHENDVDRTYQLNTDWVTQNTLTTGVPVIVSSLGIAGVDNITTPTRLTTALVDTLGNQLVKREVYKAHHKPTAVNCSASSVDNTEVVNVNTSLDPKRLMNNLSISVSVNRTALPNQISYQLIGFNVGDETDYRYHHIQNFNQETFTVIGTYGGFSVWGLRSKPVPIVYDNYYIRIDNEHATNIISYVMISASSN